MSAHADATALLRRGQALEAQGSKRELDQAIEIYHQVIATLETLSGSEPKDPNIRRDLAIARMNCGNALQKRQHPGDLRQAIAAYDKTIRILRELPYDQNPGWRNSLSAAWMNRGGAWLQLKDADRDREALQSFDHAIAIGRELPLDEQPAFRINLAAAWMHRAQVLMQRAEAPDAVNAREAALTATPLVAPLEQELPPAADISLRIRHVHCRAVAQLLTDKSPNSPAREALFDEVTDSVDEGMQLARTWEQRGLVALRPLVAELFRFGALLYLSHQPHFLAEYLLESLDPERTPNAITANAALYSTAESIIAEALRAFEATRHVTLDMPHVERHLETLGDLRTAGKRLAELQAAQPDA